MDNKEGELHLTLESSTIYQPGAVTLLRRKLKSSDLREAHPCPSSTSITCNLLSLLWSPNEHTYPWLALTIYFQGFPGNQEPINVMLAERQGGMDEFIKLEVLTWWSNTITLHKGLDKSHSTSKHKRSIWHMQETNNHYCCIYFWNNHGTNHTKFQRKC